MGPVFPPIDAGRVTWFLVWKYRAFAAILGHRSAPDMFAIQFPFRRSGGTFFIPAYAREGPLLRGIAGRRPRSGRLGAIKKEPGTVRRLWLFFNCTLPSAARRPPGYPPKRGPLPGVSWNEKRAPAAAE